jgi:hypothetical protein
MGGGAGREGARFCTSTQHALATVRRASWMRQRTAPTTSGERRMMQGCDGTGSDDSGELHSGSGAHMWKRRAAW